MPSAVARGMFETLRIIPAGRDNAKTWARPFTARLLEPGLVSYEDRGCGIALLRKETIDRCIHSYVGRPVVVRHRKTSPKNMKEVGHGYVTEVFFNPSDGWWYGRGVVDTDEAADAINKDGFCSVAYDVVGTPGPGGSWHDIDYDEEIQGFTATHLAVVPNPRYEEATIRLNSKATTKENRTMKLAFWKKTPTAPARENASAAPAADEAAKVAAAKKAADEAEAAKARENAASVTDITGESELEIPTGVEGKTEKVTLATLIECYNARSLDGEDEIDVGNGKRAKLNAVVAAYNKQCATDSESDEDKKKRENAAATKAAEEREAEAAKVRQNSGRENFRVLMTAPERQVQRATGERLDTAADRLRLGSELYGSAAPGKN